VDGLRLEDFIVGFVYDVGTTLGSYLLAQGVAEPADDDATGLVPPLGEIRFSVIRPPSDSAAPPLQSEHPMEISVSEPLSQAANRQLPRAGKRGPGDPPAT
jgi:hypothetical protein